MSRIKTIATAAVCGTAILIPTAANAAVIPVQSLTDGFAASNSTVTKTPDGVHFGTYADGGLIGGSLSYHGMDGKTLSELNDFSYTFTYRQAGATTGAAPYARVFLDANPIVDSDGDGITNNDADDDVILDPSYCATETPAQAVDQTFQMVGNSRVRFSDDGCTTLLNNQPYGAVVALHGDEGIVGLVVTQGFSTGLDVSALVRQITVNGDTFQFNVPPPAGPPGQPGATGTGAAGAAGAAGAVGAIGAIGATGTGAAGAAGATGTGALGAIGAPGAPGAPGVTTTIIQRIPVATPRSVKTACTATRLRTIQVPKRQGERLLSVRATLNGRALKSKGRNITVHLTPAHIGSYAVKLTARYRTANGAIHTVKTTRNLRLVCL